MSELSPALFEETCRLLAEHLDEESLALHSDMDQLKQKLTAHIVYLLLNRMEQLLNILYRIDVAEHKVKAVFAQQDPKLIAPELADLIIGREIQKAESRLRHRNTPK